ncbi:conserved hypothetical protein [Bradyrhizobium sp. STM 3843]|uniref:DUF4054 domain-containing protein n=1 Tax=Bradyrhizobium sp. STM 3843 TaxID=551947 RepID=UPI0002403021|nr:DUF4054 domain-containing protein [Bradyrhizobium sp. STM 3843]CCE07592.1 conserved hypothetical protein [Bradyrhizobium sp. STM 3843]
MGVIVQFNYAQWIARYPEFAQVAQPTAQEYFGEAGLYLPNDGTGPVRDAATQLRLLNMLTAHIAALNAASADGEPAPPLVGRISSATEGSVSVQTQNDYPPGTAQWFQQTKYGSAFWAATIAYRSVHYLQNKKPVVGAEPWWGGVGGFGRWPR